MTSDFYNVGLIGIEVKEKTDKAREIDDEQFWDNYTKKGGKWQISKT